MNTNRPPQFRELSNAEMSAILHRNHVGRLAFGVGEGIDIQPIHYVFSGGWIYGRTAHGSKLTAIRDQHWVAFEVDEVEDVFSWRSVVVKGVFHALPPEGGNETRATWLRAVELLKRIVSDTFDDADPVPFRTVVFRIGVQRASGREAVSPRNSAAPASGSAAPENASNQQG